MKYWLHRTNRGRVVYARPKNTFRWRDVARIADSLPSLGAEFIENNEFDPNEILDCYNALQLVQDRFDSIKKFIYGMGGTLPVSLSKQELDPIKTLSGLLESELDNERRRLKEWIRLYEDNRSIWPTQSNKSLFHDDLVMDSVSSGKVRQDISTFLWAMRNIIEETLDNEEGFYGDQTFPGYLRK